jgi:hypothetical protein
VKIYQCWLHAREAVVIPQAPASTAQGRGPGEWDEKVGDKHLALMDPGRVSGNKYRNDALGFSYEFPAGWHVLDQVAQEKLMNAASRDFYPRRASSRSGDPSPDEREARALCIRVLLWTTKHPQTVTDVHPLASVNPLAIVLAIVPDCYPGLTVPVKGSEGKYVREDIEGLDMVFTGSSLMGDDDQKIRNFTQHDRSFVQVSTIRTTYIQADAAEKTIRSEFILTQVKGYWLAWLLLSDNPSELQQLQKLQVQFD